MKLVSVYQCIHLYAYCPKRFTRMTMDTNLTLHLQESLTNALSNFLESWRLNVTQSQQDLHQRVAEENVRNVIWYLVVMIGIFSFIVVSVLVSTVKSKRREHDNDPYHKYIEGDWSSQTNAHFQSFVIANLNMTPQD
ncbi:putative potassium voltage-gated channel subfamily E member 2 [Triplophysa rosa]|uniref:Potassium voltage-gated channel subfamily E member 2 n=1 Tax=Triplophysa rosa TaxID=992332 RepID=A0A9W8C6N1_TRIRA|nr:putative potassium voltage-gated channel subfamily E member 2 [Triplophysa rosa]